MTAYAWLWAAVAIGVGLLMGQIGGRIARSAIGMGSRDESTRARSLTVSRAVFWGCTAVGLLIAAGILDQDGLEEFVDILATGLPRVFLGIVLVIVGYSLSMVIAKAVGQAAREATGVRQVGVERTLKASITAAAAVLALVVAGVDTSVLLVILVALVGAPALAVSLLTAFGARGVATQISAGRALRQRFESGWELELVDPSGTPVAGRVVEIHATFVEIESPEGVRHQVPNRWLLEQPYEVAPPLV